MLWVKKNPVHLAKRKRFAPVWSDRQHFVPQHLLIHYMVLLGIGLILQNIAPHNNNNNTKHLHVYGAIHHVHRTEHLRTGGGNKSNTNQRQAKKINKKRSKLGWFWEQKCLMRSRLNTANDAASLRLIGSVVQQLWRLCSGFPFGSRNWEPGKVWKGAESMTVHQKYQFVSTVSN